MTASDALLTFSVGPVHTFIAQARRVADVWAGSDLLSHLMATAIGSLRENGGEPVFPSVGEREEGQGIPNRLVCRVRRNDAESIARAMEGAVLAEWDRLAVQAVTALGEHGIEPAPSLWSKEQRDATRQTDGLFDIAWSWVPETYGDYARASAAAVRRYTASRQFRPFQQSEELGEKCALCGVRTALPNGDRAEVREAWQRAEAETENTPDEPFFRFDQGRLCLVCATKRLYTRTPEKRARFEALDSFQGDVDGDDDDTRRYVALVSVDGDRMGRVLAWPAEKVVDGKLEGFHRSLSQALTDFARSLRSASKVPRERTLLNLDTLGLTSRAARAPQLIYAGGDDVLVVCAPRDALPVARALRRCYLEALEPLREHLRDAADLDQLTLSGAIFFAHAKHPAGLLFRDVHDLLERKAKAEAGRNALAIRLAKRSGVPVEVAFCWDGTAISLQGETLLTWPEALDDLSEQIRLGTLSSTQSFNLRREEDVLTKVFGPDHWQPWLADRLSRGELSTADAGTLATHIAPFFRKGKAEALRIARFLGREVEAP